MQHLYLGLLLVSFLLTSIFVVPFINLLYKLRFIKKDKNHDGAFGTKTPIYEKYHAGKINTPIGGGILIVLSVCILFALILPILSYAHIYISSNYKIFAQVFVLFYTFLSFGLIGLYDDILKFFGFEKTGVFGLRSRHKFAIQVLAGLGAALQLYYWIGIDFVYVPFFGAIKMGVLYIPFSTTMLVAFANFFNITDGLDGLSCGLLMISLFAFWVLAGSSTDTIVSVFLALWIGAIIAYLYFNVSPARIMLGDVGALAFGATFALIALLLGKVVPFLVVSLPFTIEGMSSLIQILSKRFRNGKRVFPAAPIHLTLQHMGWPESKIVARSWLATIILAVFAIWLGLN